MDINQKLTDKFVRYGGEKVLVIKVASMLVLYQWIQLKQYDGVMVQEV